MSKGIPAPSFYELRPQIQDVNVRSEPHVVSQVIAVVIGIFIDDHVVAIPEPAVAEGNVKVGDAEIETAEPEATGTAAAQMPAVIGTEAAGKVSVLPGMIEMIVGIVAAGVVADPFAVGMNVWSIGMSAFIDIVWRPGVGHFYRSGTVGGRSSAADIMVLRER